MVEYFFVFKQESRNFEMIFRSQKRFEKPISFFLAKERNTTLLNLCKKNQYNSSIKIKKKLGKSCWVQKFNLNLKYSLILMYLGNLPNNSF